MTDDRSPPPAPGVCLCRPYPSSQKGGTLIARNVVDLQAHERALRCPDLYRPAGCPRCGAVLHIHDYRNRLLLADPALGVVVVRFICSDDECEATWQVLPAFVARHLWRSWRVVEMAVVPPARNEPDVPERTVRRWRRRLEASALLLVSVLATAFTVALDAVVRAVGYDGTRYDFVDAYAAALALDRGQRLAHPAEMIHRLARGVRLM